MCLFQFGMITLLMMLFNIALIMFYAIDPYFVSDREQTFAVHKIITNTPYTRIRTIRYRVKVTIHRYITIVDMRVRENN